MNAEKRKSVEAKGYKVYDHAGDAVGMTEEEKELMDLRIRLAISVRKRRERLKMTQAELAARLKTSQARIVKIECAARDVSFDKIFGAFAAMGGRVRLTEVETGNGAKKPRKMSSKQPV